MTPHISQGARPFGLLGAPTHSPVVSLSYKANNSSASMTGTHLVRAGKRDDA